MSETKKRVGAILSANEEEVQLLGYGEYVGDEVPPASDDPESLMTMLNQLNVPNPKIVLDNGNVVWGCECYWGSEDKIKAFIGDRKVAEVTI